MKASSSVSRAALLALALSGCGYHLANRSNEAFAVELGDVSTPHATIAAALVDGARAELGRHGALASNGEVLRVDLLRVDERAEGIVSGASGATPVARAVRVTIVGRAHMAVAARDTGDVEASEIVAAAPGAESGQIAADVAGSAAARRLGARLARKILGYPEP